jgi:hypothetical protein
MKKLLLAAILILCVCSFLDGWSTMNFLHMTFNKEGDPLFGAHPSDLRLWVEGTAIIAAEVGLAWWVSLKRKWAAWAFTAVFLLQAAYQFHLYLDNARSYEHIHHVWR